MMHEEADAKWIELCGRNFNLLMPNNIENRQPKREKKHE